ncbi:MAG: sigma-70 family RNA polymerase sigma factor [Chitinophagaceae bacterium]|nr:MAG: sigma-70 family RNA polymerase sigma factor [Chitinophagaceae bacterium]
MQTGEIHIKALIEGCISNDRKAQELLYRNYYKSMMSICLRYCSNETDALAILNTAFYKVFKNINRYDETRATIYTWIRAIVVNESLHHINAAKTKIAPVELTAADHVHIEPTVFEKIREANLLLLIQQLAPATKAVFNLFVMEGYTHKQIGEMLNISEGTSKWHLNDARKKLQDLIIKQGLHT